MSHFRTMLRLSSGLWVSTSRPETVTRHQRVVVRSHVELFSSMNVDILGMVFRRRRNGDTLVHPDGLFVVVCVGKAHLAQTRRVLGEYPHSSFWREELYTCRSMSLAGDV